MKKTLLSVVKGAIYHEDNRYYPDKVRITEYDTLGKETVKEWGITDGLYIDGREVRTGPPPSYEKIRKKIEKRVKHGV